MVIVIVLAAFYTFSTHRKYSVENTEPVKASDGQSYRVHKSHGDPKAAAELMAWLNDQIIEFLKVMRRRYKGATNFPQRRKATERMLALYNPDNLAETSPHNMLGDTSYVLDKGAIFAMCLRSRKENLLPKDLVMFVALHELTHIAIEDVDHPPAFWVAFAQMLRDAASAGLYAPVDYSKHPVDYCGLRVNYNPMFDDTIAPFR